jgi:hypothetical protein
MRVWMHAGILQKLCFFFVIGVVIVTVVRTVRLTVSAERRALGSKLAGSTRGLAQAALWFTGAGAACGLLYAWTPFGLTAREPLPLIAEASLDVFDLTAVSLALCGVALGGAGVFEAMGARRPSVWRLACLLCAVCGVSTWLCVLAEGRHRRRELRVGS